MTLGDACRPSHPLRILSTKRTTEQETAGKRWMEAPMGTFRLRMRMAVEFAPLPGKLWRLCKPRSSCCMNQSVNQSDGLIQNSGGVSASTFVWKTVFCCSSGMAFSSSTGQCWLYFPRPECTVGHDTLSVTLRVVSFLHAGWAWQFLLVYKSFKSVPHKIFWETGSSIGAFISQQLLG